MVPNPFLYAFPARAFNCIFMPICREAIDIFFNPSSGNAFVSRAGGLRFKFRDSQIGHNVANGSPLLQHFFQRSCVAGRHNDTEMGPANLSHASA